MNPTLAKVKKAAMKVLGAIAAVLAFVLCLLFYVFILGPYSIIARLIWPDLLDLKADPRQQSYWIKLEPKPEGRMDRPF